MNDYKKKKIKGFIERANIDFPSLYINNRARRQNSKSIINQFYKIEIERKATVYETDQQGLLERRNWKIPLKSQQTAFWHFLQI